MSCLKKPVEPSLRKTRMCRYFGLGTCTRGTACNFAHGEMELYSRPNLNKTELCLAWQRSGQCRDGNACKYAHGKEELQRPIEQQQLSLEIANSAVSSVAGSPSNSAQKAPGMHRQIPRTPSWRTLDERKIFDGVAHPMGSFSRQISEESFYSVADGPPYQMSQAADGDDFDDLHSAASFSLRLGNLAQKTQKHHRQISGTPKGSTLGEGGEVDDLADPTTSFSRQVSSASFYSAVDGFQRQKSVAREGDDCDDINSVASFRPQSFAGFRRHVSDSAVARFSSRVAPGNSHDLLRNDLQAATTKGFCNWGQQTNCFDRQVQRNPVHSDASWEHCDDYKRQVTPISLACALGEHLVSRNNDEASTTQDSFSDGGSEQPRSPDALHQCSLPELDMDKDQFGAPQETHPVSDLNFTIKHTFLHFEDAQDTPRKTSCRSSSAGALRRSCATPW